MKKFVMMATLTAIMIGCTGMGVQMDAVRERNRRNLSVLNFGMTKQQALDVMGVSTDTLVSYNPRDGAGFANPVKRIYNNPYRSSAFSRDTLAIEVIYYWTDLKRADGAVTDDELTPLVFFDNKLAGWGWDFWDDTAAKYEIRIR